MHYHVNDVIIVLFSDGALTCPSSFNETLIPCHSEQPDHVWTQAECQSANCCWLESSSQALSCYQKGLLLLGTSYKYSYIISIHLLGISYVSHAVILLLQFF